jgi:hypothetical protein
MNINEKILQFYKVFAVPALLHVCESWILTKQQLQ